MILQLGYEELVALREGARLALAMDGGAEDASLAAPVAVRSRVAALVPKLSGDVGIRTLREQREWVDGFVVIVEALRHAMESAVVATHPADENAVASYFEFAHAFSALERLHRMGRQMEAMVEVLTGSRPAEMSVEEFIFPD